MKLSEGPVIQVAWVTDDMDATESLLTRMFAVPRWLRLPEVHFDADSCTLRGEPADFVADISLGYCHDLQLELIRPVRGDSLYSEFLAQHGPGLHHVCFEVDDMEEACRLAEAEGLAVLMRGDMADGMMEFAYVDGAAGGAPYLELARLSPAIRAIYDSIKEPQ